MEGGRRRQAEPHKIRFRTSLHNTVSDVFHSRGWEETDSETEWDIFWADVGWMREVFDHIRLEEYQRVNHFRNHYELTRKDLLVKNLKRIRRQLDREGNHEEARRYDFSPETFVLPAEYALFLEKFRKSAPAVWIMKPISKAQGKGIFLFHKLNQISDWKRDHRWKAENPQAETYVVQQYIENPYLIGGRKFDFRIYALVTSYQPLTVWLYRSGFARFSNTRFSMAADDIDNTYIHLTNVAIQKTAEEYDISRGCKWNVRQTKLHMMSQFGPGPVNRLFEDIQDLIIRSLLAVQKSMINDRHCFELYGYDILVDSDLRPWLIEVNASPSLTGDTQEDYELKFGLLDDTFTIVDMEGRLTGKEQQIGGYDLIYQGEEINKYEGCAYSSMLGCHNDRIKQLEMLHKLQK